MTGKLLIAMAAVVLSTGAWADVAETKQIAGNYVEVRSADVWAGFCFSNGELGLTGEEAMIAWNVTQGGWENTDLAGLSVVAVVRANATLGDDARNPYPAKSILFVDENATEAQANALAAFAKDAGGELVSDIVDVRRAPIAVSANLSCSDDQCASVTAGDEVAIEARCFHDADKVCGHESSIYGPLTEVDAAMPHFTELSRFSGEGLGVTWNNSGRKSAYVGTFSR